jgi:hypothetical protein
MQYSMPMEIDKRLSLFTGDTGGIDSWLSGENTGLVIERLAKLPGEPLSHSLLNQLLGLSQQPPVSRAFFDYYWCSAPAHPYRVDDVPGYDASYKTFDRIETIDQLCWGLYRIYVDSLLYFGFIRNGFDGLRMLDAESLRRLFQSKRFDTDGLIARGEPIAPIHIPIDDRYLIGELACKSFEPAGEDKDVWYALYGAWIDHRARSGGRVTYKELLDAACLKPEFSQRQYEFSFAADELLSEVIEDEDQLKEKYDSVKGRFDHARRSALKNTDRYLSMVDDLDVYIATSMRTREQFREMARTCDQIFNSSVRHYNLRYFDPTLSAARGHEDKGLIECLMVKCAKVLVYMAGTIDSYGKDVEAAMALSQGKPVIFYCDAENRLKIFQDIHPLSRLVDFNSGVAVGLMATLSVSDVILLLHRIFGNEMRYLLEHKRKGCFRLIESLTGSVVRVQSDDRRLRETFWNSYHKSGRGTPLM